MCATGFDVSYRPRFPIVGQDGIALADKWKFCPEGYLGLAIPGFPNLLTFIGTELTCGERQCGRTIDVCVVLRHVDDQKDTERVHFEYCAEARCDGCVQRALSGVDEAYCLG